MLLTKFQPIKSSGSAVSPSCVEPSAQPPALVEASTSAPVMMPSPLVSTILPVPWLTGLFRSENVISTVAVDVRQVGEHAGGDLGLIEPDVGGEVRMVVVETLSTSATITLVRAGRGVPCRGSIDAPGAVESPLVAAHVLRVVGDVRDMQHLHRTGILNEGTG